jgi:protein CMS1
MDPTLACDFLFHPALHYHRLRDRKHAFSEIGTMSRTKAKARKTGGLKRKLDDTDHLDNDPPSKRTVAPVAAAVKPEPSEVDEAIARMDPALLADHFAKYVRKHSKESSSIELDDEYLPTKSFRDTTDFDKGHTAANLPEFLERFSENGKTALSSCDEKATPHTVVVVSSGIRTADLNRELRVFNTEESKVAKLIAKHMKLKANIDYLAHTKVGIAIGTPARLKDLIEVDALKTSGIKRVVVDASYQDEKKRTIFEMKDLFLPLMALLNLTQLRQRYGNEDRIEILVF